MPADKLVLAMLPTSIQTFYASHIRASHDAGCGHTLIARLTSLSVLLRCVCKSRVSGGFVCALRQKNLPFQPFFDICLGSWQKCAAEHTRVPFFFVVHVYRQLGRAVPFQEVYVDSELPFFS